jgi:hypothetical protein
MYDSPPKLLIQKGVLTAKKQAVAVTPAPCRQPAELGLATRACMVLVGPPYTPL